jgi:hypothetical protein
VKACKMQKDVARCAESVSASGREKMQKDVARCAESVGASGREKMQKDVASCAESVGASGEGRYKRMLQGVQNLWVQVGREDTKGCCKVCRICGCR